MIDGRRVLAVVPARGGSEGIPLKNLRTIGGRSLVRLAGDVAWSIPEFDRRVVSTDHPAITDEAWCAGLDAPFMRPAEISNGRVGDRVVLAHALQATEQADGTAYDIVVMLQPTSPLRTAADVLGTLRMLVDGNYDAVWTVSPTDSKAHPLKQLVIRDGMLDYWDERGAAVLYRQQMEPVYHRNGVAYAITRACLLEQQTIKGARTGAYVVDGGHISIDTEEDLAMAEELMKRNAA
jgi:CMP-N-acetylneuraminic acid synthetase